MQLKIDSDFSVCIPKILSHFTNLKQTMKASGSHDLDPSKLIWVLHIPCLISTPVSQWITLVEAVLPVSLSVKVDSFHPLVLRILSVLPVITNI